MFKIFTFHKNEDILEDWLLYHGYLFGYDNLYVIDNCSEQKYIDILKQYERLGVNVQYDVKRYIDRISILSELMRDYKYQCNLLIPLDIDEFIVKNNDVEFTCNKDEILKSLYAHKNTQIKLKFGEYTAQCFKENFTVPTIDMNRFIYYPCNNRSKTMFPAELFLYTDQGNHCGKIDGNDTIYTYTDLSVAHFKIRGYKHFERKTIKGGNAYGFDKDYLSSQKMGGQWRQWYRLYLRGVLNNYYKKHIMNSNGVEINSLADKILDIKGIKNKRKLQCKLKDQIYKNYGVKL